MKFSVVWDPIKLGPVLAFCYSLKWLYCLWYNKGCARRWNGM